MLIERALACGASYARELPGRQVEGRGRLLGAAGEEDLLPGSEKPLDSFPGITQHGSRTCGGFEEPAGRAEAHRGHVPPRDVQCQARGGIERRVLGRRDVPDEPDVACPGKIGWVARAAEHEALCGPATRRLDEERLERRLAVRRIGAEVR